MTPGRPRVNAAGPLRAEIEERPTPAVVWQPEGLEVLLLRAPFLPLLKDPLLLEEKRFKDFTS